MRLLALCTRQTRSQLRGTPLKKEGAYNTELYYQEKDEGFGDVGVGQVKHLDPVFKCSSRTGPEARAAPYLCLGDCGPLCSAFT